MKYIIDEEELKDFIAIYVAPLDKIDKKQINDYLKSKQPVEMIASGEVTLTEIGDKDQLSICDNYLGRDIKIYIEESK